MAKMKVFLSSTCYDLNVLRSQIRNFIINLGYEPYMSEYSEIVFDPRLHTHLSCVQEVPNTDMLILIIGSRFGGKAVPDALTIIDFDKVNSLSNNNEFLKGKDNLSITQLEVMKAIEVGIPIFTFVENKVLHDHSVYEKNKTKDFLMDIEFPSFSEKPEVAKYVFEFINFLRHRIENNSIIGFSKTDEIEGYLRLQWAGLFQRLLNEQRNRKEEKIRMDILSNQIADLKTVFMTSITNSELKETAKGALRYRRLIQFFMEFDVPDKYSLLKQNIEWEELLKKFNIKGIIKAKEFNDFEKYVKDKGVFRPDFLFLCKDNTYYGTRYGLKVYASLQEDWSQFKNLNNDSKEAILNAIIESEDMRMPRMIYHRNAIIAEEDLKQIDPINFNFLNESDEE